MTSEKLVTRANTVSLGEDGIIRIIHFSDAELTLEAAGDSMSAYTIEVLDLLKQPALAEGDQIFAVPTLVRQLPEPLRKIIGDLSNTEKVVVGLDLKPVT